MHGHGDVDLSDADCASKFVPKVAQPGPKGPFAAPLISDCSLIGRLAPNSLFGELRGSYGRPKHSPPDGDLVGY